MIGSSDDLKSTGSRWPDDPMVRSPDSEETVDLRRQDKIRVGQTIHRVRPCGDLDLAPSEQDVGMMALLFGQFAHAIHESQGGLKVGKLESPHDVMLADDLPLRGLRQLAMKSGKE